MEQTIRYHFLLRLVRIYYGFAERNNETEFYSGGEVKFHNVKSGNSISGRRNTNRNTINREFIQLLRKAKRRRGEEAKSRRGEEAK